MHGWAFKNNILDHQQEEVAFILPPLDSATCIGQAWEIPSTLLETVFPRVPRGEGITTVQTDPASEMVKGKRGRKRVCSFVSAVICQLHI